MDVDEDEEGTQQVKRVSDFGIEVDFDSLDEDEREVRCRRRVMQGFSDTHRPSGRLGRGIERTR